MQLKPVAVRANSSVMARCQIVSTQRPGLLEQRPELDSVVAGQARIRRAAHCVLAHEMVDNARRELLLEVEYVVADAQNVRPASCVVRILDGAAALVGLRGGRLPL